MSETGEKSRKRSRDIICEKDKQLANANQQIEAWKKKASIVDSVVGMIGVIVMICIGCAFLGAPLYLNIVSRDQYNDLSAQKWHVERNLAGYESMFQTRECFQGTFSGARVVTTSQAILLGGPITCKCGGGICVNKNGVVDTSFPKDADCTCTNSAWSADGVPFYNVTDEASAPAHLRCSMHRDGRILRESCVLRISESQSVKGISLNNFILVMCYGMGHEIWSLLVWIQRIIFMLLYVSPPVLCVVLLFAAIREAIRQKASTGSSTAQSAKRAATSKKYSCAQVFDIASRQRVPVEWADLPQDCVRAALATTKKYVYFYRHGDLIDIVDSDERNPEMSNYSIEYLREVLEPRKSPTACVLDAETNLPVEVAWKDLPEECVKNALSCTKKYVGFFRHRDRIYTVGANEIMPALTNYSIQTLRNVLGGTSEISPKSRTVHVFVFQTNLPVEVEWKDLSEKCMKAIALTTEKYVRLEKYGDEIFLRPLEKFNSDDKTCFLTEELRCIRWLECVSHHGSVDVTLEKMKIFDSRIDANVEVAWRKHIDLLKKIVSKDNVQFVNFCITDDGRFLHGYFEGKSNRVVVEWFNHVYYSIEYLRAVFEYLNQ